MGVVKTKLSRSWRMRLNFCRINTPLKVCMGERSQTGNLIWHKLPPELKRTQAVPAAGGKKTEREQLINLMGFEQLIFCARSLARSHKWIKCFNACSNEISNFKCKWTISVSVGTFTIVSFFHWNSMNKFIFSFWTLFNYSWFHFRKIIGN